VKHGCGKTKSHKAPHFFRTEQKLASFLEECRTSYEHVVVESNTMACKREGDVIIFVGGPARGSRGTRSDVKILEANAHVRVNRTATVKQWKRVLRKKLKDRVTIEDICQIFLEQKRHMRRSGPEVRTKVWFVVDNGHIFGLGLSRLLENIDRCGTLRHSARAARMSYRYAWGLIRRAEERLREPLILARAGGKGGGRTELTQQGRCLMDTYKKLSEEVVAFADERFAVLFEKEKPGE
jgi:molybdate transport system regulatory protein